MKHGQIKPNPLLITRDVTISAVMINDGGYQNTSTRASSTGTHLGVNDASFPICRFRSDTAEYRRIGVQIVPERFPSIVPIPRDKM